MFITIILYIIIGLLIYLLVRDSENFKNDVDKNCICSFDLDNTLSNSKDAKISVNECIKNKCKLIVNTARPSDWIEDIDTSKINLTNFDHYFNPTSRMQNMNGIINKKIEILEKAKKKHNVKENVCIFHFDDNVNIINSMNRKGYSTIIANENNNGKGLEGKKTLPLLKHFMDKCKK
jgi:hypothetical protein